MTSLVRLWSGLSSLGLCLLLSTCANPFLSVHQPFLDEEVEHIAGLEGTWVVWSDDEGNSNEEDALWTFTGGTPGQYTLTIADTEHELSWPAWTFRLGEQPFVCVLPSDDELPMCEESVEPFFLAVYACARLQLDRDHLTLSLVKDEWLEEHLDQLAPDTSYVVRDGLVCFTGATPQVRTQLLAIAEEQDGFSDPLELRRRPPAAPESSPATESDPATPPPPDAAPSPEPAD